MIKQGLKLFAFYIEGACFLLIYDILRDQSAKDRNVASVKIGLQCLSSMVPGAAITSNSVTIQRLLDALEHMPLANPPRAIPEGDNQLSGQISSILDNYDFISAAQDNTFNSTAGPGYPLDALVNFAAGWATFENGHYMSQNSVPEPEGLNPDIFNINWEFDNFAADLGAPF